ncbi:MAG: NUDIX domain-containing protein [Cytophagales bacterium]|nr:NUDIX domain-containing protein [Cytophagales bacterium]
MNNHIVIKHIVIKARGVLKRKGKILFCYNKAQDFFFLPGGTLEKNEDATMCLQREFQEECQLGISVGAFLGCLECHWQEDHKRYQEFNMVFNVYIQQKDIPEQILSAESHISFTFLPYESVLREGRNKILPTKIFEFLNANFSPSKYIIENQISTVWAITWWTSTLFCHSV